MRGDTHRLAALLACRWSGSPFSSRLNPKPHGQTRSAAPRLRLPLRSTSGCARRSRSALLALAFSTIIGRALPEARDGLKPSTGPSFTAYTSFRLAPNSAFKKCTKFVGDVMGRSIPRPPGNTTRRLCACPGFILALSAMRGQGRLRQCRRREPRRLPLHRGAHDPRRAPHPGGVDEDPSTGADDYSGDTKEPIVLPAHSQDLLANGAQGVAVRASPDAGFRRATWPNCATPRCCLVTPIPRRTGPSC